MIFTDFPRLLLVHEKSGHTVGVCVCVCVCVRTCVCARVSVSWVTVRDFHLLSGVLSGCLEIGSKVNE